MTETNKMDNKEECISCSRCKRKYHNTSESIENNFGYKRLGDRYKLCINCRKSKQQPSSTLKEIPIFADEISPNYKKLLRLHGTPK